MTDTTQYQNLLDDALNKPGYISSCYRTFYDYSLLNQFLAMEQLSARNLPVTPIATFKRWKELGRRVSKGQKAISLIMPVSFNKKDKDGNKTDQVINTFISKPRWFAMSQTEGKEYAPETKLPSWDAEKALKALEIERVPFEHVNGNCQGYATKNKVSVNPVARYPEKTLFHEIAHVVLGHTKEAMLSDDERTPKNLREVQAESVAYILCSLLETGNLDASRGYIQSWLGDNQLTSKDAQQIFATANKILKAGE